VGLHDQRSERKGQRENLMVKANAAGKYGERTAPIARDGEIMKRVLHIHQVR